MVDTKLYNIHILNAKTIVLESNVPIHKTYEDKFSLSSAKFSQDLVINKGDKLNVSYKHPMEYDTYYYANHIYRENKLSIRINEFEDNNSTTYLLPLLGITADQLLANRNLINCYASHYDFTHSPGQYLYLIYRYLPINYYAKFIEILQKQPDCIMYQKDRDKRFDCFIFKLENKFIEDANFILEGKFSKISENAKNLILRYHGQTNTESPLFQILYKGALRRNELEVSLGCTLPKDVDYATKPKISEETWNYLKN